ncbi:cation:proton antiporter [Endozoicomonas sp. SM1973]|uniref:Cation:proton antiporter n=1 Tax=Spartinivicinus marinus TaxID=2994442 RepID=A0A853I0U6_9GAMM|nr:cation:proton antiporter [Spartinivicinus marinus]MCX4027037.1 cation:proton antiporter [Spartinivicinus marinus]NYZ67033.1 cation:proton antiporter [Spartinivicinus marinus]
MQYDTGISVLVFIIIALLIGAALRNIIKGTQMPYSVCLLVIGLGLGLIQRSGFFTEHSELLDGTLKLVAEVDPHLILFLFLPTLIFESAFSLEVHLFRRIFAQIALLAVPGLIVATTLTAALAKWTFPWEWSWALCLMFGAMISATDPVAVVAMLKEVSSRKRLETLIEGESLLNDGTAIVFFSLFYGWVISAGGQEGGNIFGVAGDFTWVVSIGLILGVLAGFLVMAWIGRVFNDPMIEITLSIATAYLVYFAAEKMHVSGIVAVVTLALMFAGIGRTRISPEVAEFLHNFWEMMAHIANTLIFLLVGVLIAARVHLDDINAWIALVILYVGIQLIRALAVTLFMPLLKRIGIGITREKAIVLVWGGLRGAVSLALALIIAQDDVIPRDIRDQILFLCAGIVVFTILINGASMSWVLKKLKLDQLPPAKQATVDKAQAKINEELTTMLPVLVENEFLKGADWDEVKHTTGLLKPTEIKEPEKDSESISDADLSVAFRRRLLETERRHYWHQFEQGTLGKQSTNKLVEAVEHALDGEPVIAPRESLYKVWDTPPLLHMLRNVKGLKKLALRVSFSRLALGYEIARGFIQAQDTLETHISSLAPDEVEAAKVNALVQENKKKTLEYIQQLRETFPEIVHTLETHSAIRLLLNRERAVIREQLKKAVLDSPEAKRMIKHVETRMKTLQKMSSFSAPFTPDQLLGQLSWCKHLSEDTRNSLNNAMEHGLYSSGEWILKQGKPFAALGIIARGSVQVQEERKGKKYKKVLGPGEHVTALSLLTGVSPGNYRAMTLVDILWLRAERLKPLMAHDEELAEAVSKLLN